MPLIKSLVSNIFEKHHIDECCGNDDLRPFMSFIYFLNGKAYATDAHVLVAVSLQDINADDLLIQHLEGYKIHREDFKLLKKFPFLYLEELGIILLNERTIQLNLLKINEDDENKQYQKILEIIPKAIEDIKTQKILINKIKFYLPFAEKINKVFQSLGCIVRFRFLQKPDRIFIEFDIYKNSYALIMPMIDVEN